ncbi:MAG: HD domain-containing phosphohydrolase [Candidatus Latescibacterota bacterium]
MLRTSRQVRSLQPLPVGPEPAGRRREAPPPEPEPLPAGLAAGLGLGLDVEPAGDADQDPRQGEAVYRQLVQVAEHVYAASECSRPLDEATVIAGLRQALAALRVDDALLSETVRQRQESRSWPQRAANTAVLAMRLGAELEYDERRLLALGLCALMHDVGMLRVPREILDGGRLTPEQLQVLKRHPLDSQEIVNGFGAGFEWAAKIVVQVHERYDGSGYPAGLRDGEVHEMARIIGVADTYEAMAHPRADREARVTYHALKEIIDLRNTLYERRVIKALIQIVSIFPLGSLVKLNNGEIGRVIATSRTHPTRPVVEVLIDSRQQRLSPPRRLDLQDEPMLYIVDPAIDEGVLGSPGA